MASSLLSWRLNWLPESEYVWPKIWRRRTDAFLQAGLRSGRPYSVYALGHAAFPFCSFYFAFAIDIDVAQYATINDVLFSFFFLADRAPQHFRVSAITGEKNRRGVPDSQKFRAS